MMIRAYWQFYKDCFPFIVSFAIVCFLLVDIIPGIIILFTLANVVGFLGFSITKPQQFYFYYNLGIGKLKLFLACCLINLFVAIPVSLAIVYIKSLFF